MAIRITTNTHKDTQGLKLTLKAGAGETEVSYDDLKRYYKAGPWDRAVLIHKNPSIADLVRDAGQNKTGDGSFLGLPKEVRKQFIEVRSIIRKMRHYQPSGEGNDGMVDYEPDNSGR